jgi:hypothetical protein
MGHNLSVCARIIESQRQTRSGRPRMVLSEDEWISGNNPRLFFQMTSGNAQASKLMPGKHCRWRRPVRFTFA